MMERLQCLAASNSLFVCEGICLQIHSRYIFTQRFVLDGLPLSSQTGPAPELNLASISYCLIQIKLEWI